MPDRAGIASPVDLVRPAINAGWLGASACGPNELFCGAVLLPLASQHIAVRAVQKGADTTQLLDKLADDLCTSFFAEQYVVMVGFEPAHIAEFRQRIQHSERRHHAGSYEEYLEWLKTRLGPIGTMTPNSPLRKLLEPFLGFSRAPSPEKRATLRRAPKYSHIKKSFDLGYLGTQACATLFAHVRGARHVVDVENIPYWQKRDVDMRVRALVAGVAGSYIDLDAKTEDYRTGNLSLELFGNLEGRVPGWLHFSEMQVLVSIMWPTGDMILADFCQVRDWVLGTEHGLRISEGKAEGQTYHSLVALCPITTMLSRFNDSAFLRIEDWLDRAYAGQFEHPSLVPASFSSRRLVPQRSL